MRASFWVIVCCVVAGALGCEVGAKSGAGLRLPNGDIVRGKQTFHDLGCDECHTVGRDSAPTTDPSAGVLVALGGKVSHIETHGELVTSIINPSHGISRRYPADQVMEGGGSKMPSFNETMTVEELINLTAFLQSRYELDQTQLYGP